MKYIIFLAMMFLTSCSIYRPLSEPWMKDDPVVGKTLMKKEFDTLKPPVDRKSTRLNSSH